MVSEIDSALIAAYEATDYIVFDGKDELTLRIGQPNAAFAELLGRHRATTAAIITASNPESIVLSAEKNAERHAMLLAALQQLGLTSLRAEGRDPLGALCAEVSCCVLNVSRSVASAVGRHFAQNAIVFTADRAAPRLILLR